MANFILAYQQALDRKYTNYVLNAGVKRILLHEFRHSHASYLINKGVSPLIVAQRLGHSDVATTLNTYSHLYPSKQAEVIAFIEEDLVKKVPNVATGFKNPVIITLRNTVTM